jgi:hypothetical protein
MDERIQTSRCQSYRLGPNLTIPCQNGRGHAEACVLLSKLAVIQ